jgi:ketosteroid isomerase-like protein
MHIASGPTYGIEAKNTEILNQLAAWHVPTNNVTSVVADHTNGGDNLQAEREAVNRLVDAYVDAYDKRDAQALWQIWPDPPPQTRQAIEAYFRSARSIAMKVADRRIEANGTNATVMAQSSQEFVPKNGSPQKSPEGPVTLELEKARGGWIITLVR